MKIYIATASGHPMLFLSLIEEYEVVRQTERSVTVKKYGVDKNIRFTDEVKGFKNAQDAELFLEKNRTDKIKKLELALKEIQSKKIRVTRINPNDDTDYSKELVL